MGNRISLIQADDEIRREITEAVQGAERGEEEAKIQIAMKGKAWKRKKVIPLPDKKELLRKKYGDGNVLGIDDETESSSDDMDEDEDDEEEEEEEEEEEDESKSELETDAKSSAQRSEAEREPMVQPKEENAVKPVSETSFRTTVHVPVTRTPEIQAMREKLPIVAEEQVIMEAINENPVVILEGETGSGKTTQVPQFLYEAGYATGGKIIGVTEPRRVAAMAMSKRVGEEMGDESLSSYQVRFEGNVTAQTKIKFMTDGVLLREMEKDFRLRKYSVVVIDEAHERSVFTDILLGFLSRVVRMRQKDEENGPLKLVVMSATLRAEDFTQNTALFKSPPPKISVEGRQFETECKFKRNTPDDYVAAALKKTAEIHEKEPQGGILVFLTGQQEVNNVVRKLRTLFPSRRQTNDGGGGEEETLENVLKSAVARAKKRAPKNLSKMGLSLTPEVDLDSYRAVPLDDTETDALRSLEEDDDLAEEEGAEGEGDQQLAKSVSGCSQPMWTLPLYSLLNSERQRRVFEPVPEGHRLCVVATNIAETSLTIPGIKYVVDCGKVNTKFYDRLTGVSTFRVTWTSKAAADQRKGRAGRQGPGRCYRLYSSAVFEDKFSAHAPPEICKRPVDDLVLQMKAMNIVNVVHFPFPTPPDPSQLRVAEERLLFLGALREVKELKNGKELKTYRITDLGKSMSRFPVAPCFSKMIALSGQHGLMPYTIAMVAALSVQEVLMETPVGDHADAFDKDEVTKIRRVWAGKGNALRLGDPGLLLRAVCAAERDAASSSRGGSLDNFCNKYALRRKAMVEIRKLRQQLTNEVNLVLPHLGLSVDPWLEPPSDRPDRPQAKLLRQIIASGMSNQVAKKVDVEEEIADPKERKNYKLAYRVSGMEDPVFLHSKTVFALKQRTEPLPEWIAYQEIFETDKLYVRGATAVEPGWLPEFAPAQCHLQPPLSEPEPWYEDGRVTCRVNGTFGKSSFILPVMTLPHPEDADGTSIKYFARFLLEGRVLPELSAFADDLPASLPATFTRTVSFHSERVKSFYSRLVSGGNIDRMDRLRAAFEKDKDFLKPEFKLWVSQDRHDDVDEVWTSLFKND